MVAEAAVGLIKPRDSNRLLGEQRRDISLKTMLNQNKNDKKI